MAEKEEIRRVTITKWMNRSRFLQLEDALEIGKIRIWIGEYQKGNGMQASAQHFMDLDDARVVFDDLANGRALAYQEYKGSVNGSVISRVLSIKKDTKSGEGYWFEVKNGPGKVMPTGAVQPAGEPTAQVAAGLPIYDARRLAHVALAYIRAWEARNLLYMKSDESGMLDMPRPKSGTEVTLAKAG